MSLTVIIPNINNKQALNTIKKSLTDEDEIFNMRVTSKNIKTLIDNCINNAKNEQILLINPSDPLINKKDFVDKFRFDEMTVSNTSNLNLTSFKSSIKFNKTETSIETEGQILNVTTYVKHLFNNHNSDVILSVNTKDFVKKDFVKKTQIDGIVYNKKRLLPIREVQNQPKDEFVNKPLYRSTNDVLKRPRIRRWSDSKTAYKGGTPKILIVCDVKGWAWWIKANQIKKYLSDKFIIDIIYRIGDGAKEVGKAQGYDLVMTFGWAFVHEMREVPFEKRITGVTAHRDVRKIGGSLKQAKYLTANSVLLYNEFKNVNKNIFYTPNGVNEEMFQKFEESDLLDSDRKIRITHIGKLSPQKRQKEIIEPAMDILKNYGFEYNPHYLDYFTKIPHSEMPEVYRGHDLLVISSREDGTPASVLEGGAMSLPMIGNKIGNLPEFIINGYNGYIVPEPTVKNYVDYFRSLDRTHIVEMGKNARETIETGWTWEIQSENYRNMFNDILGISQ